MSKALNGKIALVTGGSRGIGRAVALRLAQQGALVCVHYGTSKSGGETTVQEITAAGGQAFALGADLRNPTAIADLFKALDKELSARKVAGLDILINNAGIGGLGDIATITDQRFDDLINTNVKGLFQVTRHALSRIRDGGRIVNLSSSVSLMAFPSTIVYAMTKAAVNHMTLSLAAQLGPRNITVNAVAPGATETEFLSGLTPEFKAHVVAGIALGRMAQPDEMAGVISFLVGQDGGFITGQVIAATGGTHL